MVSERKKNTSPRPVGGRGGLGQARGGRRIGGRGRPPRAPLRSAGRDGAGGRGARPQYPRATQWAFLAQASVFVSRTPASPIGAAAAAADAAGGCTVRCPHPCALAAGCGGPQAPWSPPPQRPGTCPGTSGGLPQLSARGAWDHRFRPLVPKGGTETAHRRRTLLLAAPGLCTGIGRPGWKAGPTAAGTRIGGGTAGHMTDPSCWEPTAGAGGSLRPAMAGRMVG